MIENTRMAQTRSRFDDGCPVNVVLAQHCRGIICREYTLASARINNRWDDCEISAGDGCWKLDDSSPLSFFLARINQVR